MSLGQKSTKKIAIFLILIISIFTFPTFAQQGIPSKTSETNNLDLFQEINSHTPEDIEVPEQTKQNAISQVLEKLEEDDKINLIVWLEKSAEIQDVLDDFENLNVKYTYEKFNGFAITDADQKTVSDLLEKPRVLYVVYDAPAEGHLFQSAPLIQADQVHSTLNIDGSGIGVCHLDSGVDYTHTNLANSYAGGHDFVNNDNDPMDDNGHGTATAGVIASDHSTVQGVAPGIDLYEVKVLDSNAMGTTSDIIAGLNWCITNKNSMNIKVVSMSLGTSQEYTPSTSPGLYDPALIAASQINLPIVSSSGNHGTTNSLSYPAISPHTISVGATYNGNQGSRTYTFGSFTCTDPTTQADQIACFSNTAPSLDLMAPGTVITSLGISSVNPFSSTAGTSMAAPHVAGTIALMAERNPQLSISQIKDILSNSGPSVTEQSSGMSFTRINSLNSLQLVPYLEVIGTLTPGTTMTFNIHAPGEAGNDYIFALSTLDSPGTPLGDGRVVPIQDDGFLYPITIQYPNMISLTGSTGQIDSNGNAQAQIPIPSYPGIQTMDIYSAFVTLDPSLPFPPVRSVSNGVQL